MTNEKKTQVEERLEKAIIIRFAGIIALFGN